MEMKEWGPGSRLLLMMAALLLGVFLMGQACNGSAPTGPTTTRPATPTATQVAVVGLESRVRRFLAEVWAGPSGVDPLPQLTDNRWRDLPVNGLVTTDSDGEAWVDIADCQIIYVFQASELVAGPCPKSGRGNTMCSRTGATAARGCTSNVRIQTPSADVEPMGTWFAVIYLPERQLTLAIVLEGEVAVFPVREFDSRRLGNPVPVGEQAFLYTAPDAMLEPIAGLRPRTALPLEQLPSVIQELGVQPWIDRIRPRAQADDVPFPEFAAPEVFLEGGGEVLENEAVEEAMLRAVPWADLMDELFPGQDVPVIALFPDIEVDARDVEYDPDVAQELLAEAGFEEGLGLVLLFPEDDEPLAVMAERVTGFLNKVGIEVKTGAVTTGEAPEIMRELVLSGGTALWLGREPLDVDLSPPATARDETAPTLGRTAISPANPSGTCLASRWKPGFFARLTQLLVSADLFLLARGCSADEKPGF